MMDQTKVNKFHNLYLKCSFSHLKFSAPANPNCWQARWGDLKEIPPPYLTSTASISKHVSFAGSPGLSHHVQIVSEHLALHEPKIFRNFARLLSFFKSSENVHVKSFKNSRGLLLVKKASTQFRKCLIPLVNYEHL